MKGKLKMAKKNNKDITEDLLKLKFRQLYGFYPPSIDIGTPKPDSNYELWMNFKAYELEKMNGNDTQ